MKRAILAMWVKLRLQKAERHALRGVPLNLLELFCSPQEGFRIPERPRATTERSPTPERPMEWIWRALPQNHPVYDLSAVGNETVNHHMYTTSTMAVPHTLRSHSPRIMDYKECSLVKPLSICCYYLQ